MLWAFLAQWYKAEGGSLCKVFMIVRKAPCGFPTACSCFLSFFSSLSCLILSDLFVCPFFLLVCTNYCAHPSFSVLFSLSQCTDAAPPAGQSFHLSNEICWHLLHSKLELWNFDLMMGLNKKSRNCKNSEKMIFICWPCQCIIITFMIPWHYL